MLAGELKPGFTDPSSSLNWSTMISGKGSVELAVEATKAGAYDFLEKPLDTDRLLVTTKRALELRGLAAEVHVLGTYPEWPGRVGRSDADA